MNNVDRVSNVSLPSGLNADGTRGVPGVNFDGKAIMAPQGSKITRNWIGGWIALFTAKKDLADRNLKNLKAEEANANPDQATLENLRQRFEILQALVKLLEDLLNLFTEKFAETVRNCGSSH